MHGMDVFMLKNCDTFAPDTRKQPYVYEWSLIFFHKLLVGDIELSDLERTNRKLSAHNCTDHIKTLFSSDNYHETRNINTSQATMPISLRQYQATTVPHYSYQSTKYIMYLPYWAENNIAAWKRSTRIDRSCCGGIILIITGRFVPLLVKKYQQDKK